MEAIIDISEIAAELEAVRTAVHPHEFSGFGIVEPGLDSNGKTSFVIKKWFLLDVGSSVLTTISIQDQLRLKEYPDIKFMRCWIHAHPVGDGVPGPHCWSGTDDNAIENSPMGTVPELMDWMIAIVRTPGGWVGRFDLPGKETHHLNVAPSFRSIIFAAKDLVQAYNEQRYADVTEREAPPLFGFLRPIEEGIMVQQSFEFVESEIDFNEKMAQFGHPDPDKNYWLKNKERLNATHREVPGIIRPERVEGKDYGKWWSGFLDDVDTGEDGSLD